jgi:hypothetical protein
MRKVFDIDLPVEWTYNLWQPWLKGYQGESALGVAMSGQGMLNWLWVDQNLKKSITGKIIGPLFNRFLNDCRETVAEHITFKQSITQCCSFKFEF